MEQDDTTADEGKFAELELSDSTVIYDRGNHQAWLQSDGAVEARAMV